jgi:hypothetical protein
MSKRILIPVINVPPQFNYRGDIDNPRRVVPHCITSAYYPKKVPSPKEGDSILPNLFMSGSNVREVAFADKPGWSTNWIADPRWIGKLSVWDHRKGFSSSCYLVKIRTNDGLPPVEGFVTCKSFNRFIPYFVGGEAPGVWTAVKRGQHYMIDLVDE